MMSARGIIIVVTLFLARPLVAQTYTDRLQAQTSTATVRIHQSAAIDAVVNGKINTDEEDRIAKEEAKKAAEQTTPAAPTVRANDDDESSTAEVDTQKKVYRNAYKTTGYRVQVFAGSNSREDKAKAESIGTAIKHLFPDQPVYVHFYSPRWICRMGNYRTFDEAQAVLTRVQEAGYNAATIVKGTITLTN